MPKATDPYGLPRPIDQCYIVIPGLSSSLFPGSKIILNNLPEIGDSKDVQYNTEGIMGRSSPIHTYYFSNTRTITVQFHFFIFQPGDEEKNLMALRAIQSCAYPRDQPSTALNPFLPPVICLFRCGNLVAVEQDLCVILHQYSVKFPTEVVWDADTLCPYKFDIDTTWWVVYNSTDLPFQNRIIQSGR